MKRPVVLITIIALLGCSKPPSIPELPSYQKHPIEQIILSNQITVSDFRKIFAALNQNGKLSKLQSYLNRLSDEDLSQIAPIFSKHLYERAFDRGGLIEILKKRVADQSFHTFKLENWTPQKKQWLTSTLEWPELPKLIAANKGLIEPTWSDALFLWKERTSPSPSSGITSKEWIVDLEKFLDSKGPEQWIELSQKLNHSHLGYAFMDSLGGIHQKFGRNGFDGFTLTLQKMMQEKKFVGFLDLVNQLNQPSEGLFIAAQEKIKEPGFVDANIAVWVKPLSYLMAYQFLKEGLSSLKPKELSTRETLFPIVLESIRKIVGTTKTHESKSALYLNSYVLAGWIEKLLTLHKGEEDIWKAKVKIPSFKWFAFDPHPTLEGKKRLSEVVSTYSESEDFINELTKLGPSDLLGDFNYNFTQDLNSLPFDQALKKMVQLISVVRPFSDVGGFVHAFVYPLTRPSGPYPSLLERLENDNLFVFFNQLMNAVPYSIVKQIHHSVFEEVGFLHLNESDSELRTVILDLFADSKLKPKIEGLLNAIPYFYGLDHSVRSLPSGLQIYHAALSSIPTNELPALGSLLGFAHQSEIFAPEKHPTLVRWASTTPQIASWTAALGTLSRNERHSLWQGLSPAITDQKGIRYLFDLLKRWLSQSRAGLEQLIDSFDGESVFSIWKKVTKEEKKWALDVIDEEDLAALHRIFLKAGGSSKFKEVVNELAELEKNGILKEATELLLRLQNDRIHHSTTVFKEGLQKGEVRELLRFLQEAF